MIWLILLQSWPVISNSKELSIDIVFTNNKLPYAKKKKKKTEFCYWLVYYYKLLLSWGSFLRHFYKAKKCNLQNGKFAKTIFICDLGSRYIQGEIAKNRGYIQSNPNVTNRMVYEDVKHSFWQKNKMTKAKAMVINYNYWCLLGEWNAPMKVAF